MTHRDLPPAPDAPDPLATLNAEVQPPDELRTQVVAALRARGHIRTAPTSRPSPAWWGFAAAALLLAFLGGRMTAATPETSGLTIPEGRSGWAFLLFEDAAFDAGDLEPHEIVSAYDQWAASAAEQGVLLLAEKFADEETLLVGGEAITRPLAMTGQGMLGGLFVVAAPDRDAAVALARETPHHALGGIVVVREIDRLPR